MKALRSAVLSLLLACPLAALATVNGNEASQRLVSEGQALFMQGKYNPAMEKFQAARKESPEASSPVSSLAYMLYLLAAGSTTPEALKQIDEATALARGALALSPDDPLANEVLRLQEDNVDPPHHKPSKEVDAMYREAEVLFHNGKYEEARYKYREVARADPKYAKALLMEGDTYFMEKNWAAAEPLFKMAAELDPLDAQAWRFLADSRIRLGDREGYMYAVMSAIAAMPSQKGSWDRLKAALESSGKPLVRLNLQRKAWVTRDAKDGKYTVNIAEAPKAGKDADQPVWMAYAMSLVTHQEIDKAVGKESSPFRREVQAWEAALAVPGEVKGQDLQTLRKLQAAGELEAAIYILMYKEAFRADYEAWKKANPAALGKFIDTWRLMP